MTAEKKVIVYIFFYLTAVVTAIGCVAKIPPPVGGIVFLVIVFGGLFLLVRWHTKTFGYRCPTCNHEFAISVLTNFISPHFPDVKYLRCPRCRTFGWAKAMVNKVGESKDGRLFKRHRILKRTGEHKL
jgi:predicted RNA-binding Zn-ribbon protein involved in translation (DUF1610 family)